MMFIKDPSKKFTLTWGSTDNTLIDSLLLVRCNKRETSYFYAMGRVNESHMVAELQKSNFKVKCNDNCIAFRAMFSC